MSVFGGFGLDGDVGGGEGGDVVLVGVGGGGVVLATVDEMEADGLGVGGVGGPVDDDGLSGGGDVGVGGLGEVGEEDVMPEGGSGGGSCVLDVEHAVLELFIEDPRLDFEGSLRGREGFADRDETGSGAGREVEGVEEAEGESDAETMETMRTKSMAPMPAARMAVISLSAARRERPRRMPTSTAMGMVTLSVGGTV